MKFLINRYCHSLRFLPVLLSVVILFALSKQVFAQEPPPRPVDVTVTQNLGFGAFSHGVSGGTISVSTSGTRSATGTVILLNLGFSFSAAVFRLVANPGTLITILNGSPVSLPGSNGGSLTLTIGASNPSSPFVIATIPPAYTTMNIGGTLTVGNSVSNPPGSYSGTFDITFIQE
jgi:Domain of unknown function (DUF4402)